MADRNAALTFEQQVTAAFVHYVRGVEQQDIAMLFSTNIGRVNEACVAVRRALNGVADKTPGEV